MHMAKYHAYISAYICIYTVCIYRHVCLLANAENLSGDGSRNRPLSYYTPLVQADDVKNRQNLSGSKNLKTELSPNFWARPEGKLKFVKNIKTAFARTLRFSRITTLRHIRVFLQSDFGFKNIFRDFWPTHGNSEYEKSEKLLSTGHIFGNDSTESE